VYDWAHERAESKQKEISKLRTILTPLSKTSPDGLKNWSQCTS